MPCVESWFVVACRGRSPTFCSRFQSQAVNGGFHACHQKTREMGYRFHLGFRHDHLTGLAQGGRDLGLHDGRTLWRACMCCCFNPHLEQAARAHPSTHTVRNRRPTDRTVIWRWIHDKMLKVTLRHSIRFWLKWLHGVKSGVSRIGYNLRSSLLITGVSQRPFECCEILFYGCLGKRAIRPKVPCVPLSLLQRSL